MTFVDTGAWFAAFVPSDRRHAEAAFWFQQNTGPLLTTDFVVDETLTLLRARGEPLRAIAAGAAFFSGSLAEVHHLSPDEVRMAWDIFRNFADKQWSFTDCPSKIVMASRQISAAFAFDHHSRQFGAIAIVP